MYMRVYLLHVLICVDLCKIIVISTLKEIVEEDTNVVYECIIT